MQHEAGHFLIAYLVGILPKGYTLTSFEALKKEGSLNVQAGTAFVDFEFLEEVGSFLQFIFLLVAFLLYVLYNSAPQGFALSNLYILATYRPQWNPPFFASLRTS